MALELKVLDMVTLYWNKIYQKRCCQMNQKGGGGRFQFLQQSCSWLNGLI